MGFRTERRGAPPGLASENGMGPCALPSASATDRSLPLAPPNSGAWQLLPRWLVDGPIEFGGPVAAAEATDGDGDGLQGTQDQSTNVGRADQFVRNGCAALRAFKVPRFWHMIRLDFRLKWPESIAPCFEKRV